MARDTYQRTKENYDTASEAWDDIVADSVRVEGFEQVVERDHTPNYWRFIVEIDPEKNE
jgi:hypothetical protein